MAQHPLDAETVQVLLFEAVDTLRRLRVPFDGPAPARALWPTPVQQYWEAYGRDAAKARLSPPSPRAITRMDGFMLWVLALMREARDEKEANLWVAVLWARPNSSFQKIADMITHTTGREVSKTTAYRLYTDCLQRLTNIAKRSLAA